MMGEVSRTVFLANIESANVVEFQIPATQLRHNVSSTVDAVYCNSFIGNSCK